MWSDWQLKGVSMMGFTGLVESHITMLSYDARPPRGQAISSLHEGQRQKERKVGFFSQHVQFGCNLEASATCPPCLGPFCFPSACWEKLMLANWQSIFCRELILGSTFTETDRKLAFRGLRWMKGNGERDRKHSDCTQLLLHSYKTHPCRCHIWNWSKYWVYKAFESKIKVIPKWSRESSVPSDGCI